MKKNNIFILLLIIVLILIFSIIVYLTLKKDESEKDYIVYINVNELKEKINNKDDFILVFTQDGCGHCQTYHGVINSVSEKYNIKIYDVNLTSLEKDEINEVNKIASINGTPTTLFFKDGEEITTLHRINGQTSENKLVKKLKQLGYIKE